MATGKKAASAAGKTLGKKGEPKLEKTAEASALSQAKKGSEKKK
jgi:hypothetical protein